MDIDTLRSVLSYNPASGALTWKPRCLSMFSSERAGKSWNTKYAGRPALTAKASTGYLNGAVFGKNVLAHRVAFAIWHGRWPKGEVDHVNGVKNDNRIKNLRDVTRSSNQKNRRINSNNTSGASGVRWRESAGKWVASVRSDGVNNHLGYFLCKEDAVAAVDAFRSRSGFTDRHGT